MNDSWKICALCRNLEMVDQGREFEKIADTEYMVFRCRVLGWSTRENYLMDSDPAGNIGPVEPTTCPHWEPHTRE